MTTPLHGVDHRFKSGWAHFFSPPHSEKTIGEERRYNQGMTTAQTPANQSTSPRKHSRRTWTILLVLFVAVVIVIAGVAWYVLTLGFGPAGPVPPRAAIWHDEVPNGFRCTFGYWTTENSRPVPWSELMIQLTEGTNYASWHVNTQDLNAGTSVTHDYGVSPFGSLSVFLNVSDVAGNGYADHLDSFEITAGNGAFSYGDVYLVFVLWEPDGHKVCTDYVIW